MTLAAPPAVALADLLRSMADEEFVIGFSDSEWTGIAPVLEEDVAMSSLAQDEIGHAAALYGLLAQRTGGDADAIAYDRPPEAYRHARLLDRGRGDWAMTIARRYLYETADAIRLEALAGGTWSPLAGLVGKLQREERYHRMHIAIWFDRLARAGGESRQRLTDALGTLAPDAELAAHYARELFGRRQESVRLWVVRRADVVDLDDPDLLQPPLDRSFKKPGGYVMREKLAAAREAAGQAKPKARSK